MITLTILTILNSIAILYLILSTKSKYYIEFGKKTTAFVNTLLEYSIIVYKKTDFGGANSVFSIYIPVRNRRKVELKESIERLLKENPTNRNYSLRAMFSWLKTLEEVKQFEKNYSIVDKELVAKLVSGFIEKER